MVKLKLNPTSGMTSEVAIGGGSVAGLSAARVAAALGIDVEVIENDMEIGMPEKCGGLISVDGLTKLGIAPTRKILLNTISEGKVVLSDTSSYEFDLKKAGLVVLNRNEFDKELASLAVRAGARISIGERIESVQMEDEGVTIRTNKRQTSSKLMINAMGAGYYPNKRGLIPAFQNLIAVKDGFYDGILVFIDKVKIGDFFGWYIPLDDGFAKIGAGGRTGGQEADRYFESALQALGIRYQVIKRINASLVVGGYVRRDGGRILSVGDAAGQTKPTTAGGIITGGVGGAIAGRVARDALEKGDFNGYTTLYDDAYGKELARQVTLAQVYRMLNDKQLKGLMDLIKDEDIEMDSADFDFHSYIIRKVLTSKVGASLISSIIPRLAIARLKGLF